VTAEIIAVGAELLTPYRQDTNSLYLTDELNKLGVEVTFKTVVGDKREHLRDATRVALGRADIVILMGGLGPTEDDLTREGVADALGRELHRDPEIVTKLYVRFASRKMRMPENNARQADIIEGAVLLPNANGTAPGQWLDVEQDGNRKMLMLLPGPPWELKALFSEQCISRLAERLPQRFIATRLLKVAMVPESQCDARIAPIYKKYADVQTTILAGAGEIQLHLRCQSETLEAAKERVDALASEIEEELGDTVFATAGESLEQIVGYLLQVRGQTLAVAESCTGGLLAERITSVSGSSRYFLGGAVVYANDLKSAFTDVPPLLIQQHGAVSPEVAIAMSEGVRKRTKATIGVGITGVAGPTGGTDEKPVGLVYVAVADGGEPAVVERKFLGDRERVRWWASQQALDMVRRRLM
jgi:nicotinamide-nucleotide amidase